MKPNKVNPLRLREITPYVDVVIDGMAWKAIAPLPGVGWELANKARPKERCFLTTEEYEELKAAERVVLVSEIHAYASLASLTPLQRKTAFLRSFWMEVVDTALQEGTILKLTRGTAGKLIEDNEDLIAKRWREHEEESDFDHGKPRRKRKVGSFGSTAQEKGDIDPARLRPCTKTLIQHYDTWIKSGRDFWALVPNADPHSQGGREIDPRTWHQLQQLVPRYASEKQPTLQSICTSVNIEIDGLNAALGEDNRIPRATTYGVAKAITELPASVVIGGRLGKKRMRQALAHVAKGPEYKRVGEMTLHDCWTTDVFALIPDAARHLFSEKELHTRVVIAVVVDAASGAIIGLKAGTKETAELVKAALRMAGSDKTQIAHAAGCQSSWDMRVGTEEVKSDSGKAYRSGDFMGSVYSIADRLTFTAAGKAHLRGMVERKFREMGVQFISKVTGRTGSNIGERLRDELDPEKRATLFVDELLKMLIRYVVDVLHYTAPKRGLAPARKFEEIIGRLQCKAPPTEDEVRVAFGVLVQRMLNRAGIRFMNIIYYSAWLDIVLATQGPQVMQIRVDEENLGRISVLIGSDWTTIPGPPQMEGVSLSEWVSRQAELARKYGEQARLDFARYVAPAIRDIEREAKRAEDFFKLENVYWTAEMMDQIEKDLRVFVLYDRDPEGDERGLTGDSSVLGSVHTRTGSPVALQSADVPAVGRAANVLPPPAASAQPPEEPAQPVMLLRKHTRKDR